MPWEMDCGGSYKDNLYCNPQVNTASASGTKMNTTFEMKFLLSKAPHGYINVRVYR
jgi:hypothetical protein